MHGINDHEAGALLRLCLDHGHQSRFIEQGPVDAQHGWRGAHTVSAGEIFTSLSAEFTLTPNGLEARGSARAETFQINGGPDGVGIIGSLTRPFCGTCDRVRLTADARSATGTACTRGKAGWLSGRSAGSGRVSALYRHIAPRLARRRDCQGQAIVSADSTERASRGDPKLVPGKPLPPSLRSRHRSAYRCDVSMRYIEPTVSLHDLTPEVAAVAWIPRCAVRGERRSRRAAKRDPAVSRPGGIKLKLCWRVGATSS
jgi:hypothetical protein